MINPIPIFKVCSLKNIYKNINDLPDNWDLEDGSLFNIKWHNT